MAQGIVSSGYTDLTHFYDCSWTIYTCSWNPPTTFRRDDLTRQIQTDLRRRSSDDDDLPERSGELQECTAESISIRLGRDSVSSGLLISVVYDKALHKFVIYGSEGVAVSLLLVKAPAAVTKKVFTVLSDALDMSFPLLLRLPSSLLQSQLEFYLKKLDGADSGHTTSLVTDVLHDLKVSIAFEAPIAPSLRSLEIDVPPTTIRIMKNESPQGQFMKLLAEHVRSQTGLNLPAATSAHYTTSSVHCILIS